MEIYAVIAAIWLILFATYYLWPSLRRRSSVYPSQPALRSRIVSTSYLQSESELSRYRRQVEEAKAALAKPGPRRAPVVSETVPSAPTPAAAAATVAEPVVAPRPAPVPQPLEPLLVGATASLARSQPLAQAFGSTSAVATAAAVDAAEVAYLRSQVTDLRRELAAAESRPAPAPRTIVVDHSEEVEALRDQVEALELQLATQAASALPEPAIVVADRSAEVAALEAQVEALQSQLATATSKPKRVARPAARPATPRTDQPRRHHHPAGDYTELPPSLRRLVVGARRRPA